MIENEIKLCIKHSSELEHTLTARYGWHDIKQGYLNNNSRIREITHQSGLVDHIFSFKQRLPNGRNIEIESEEITKEDFDDLWEFTESRLFKRRVSRFIKIKDSMSMDGHAVIRWDIDFLRMNEVYFDMAEVEMPSHMERPPFILEDIQPYVIYEVPRSDNRFSARKLSDQKHAKKLAHEIGLKNE